VRIVRKVSEMPPCVKKEDELDANQMWQIFQDGSTARAKEILEVSKGKLNIGKESWFRKGEAIKKVCGDSVVELSINKIVLIAVSDVSIYCIKAEQIIK
jgi:hypothetical protein